MKGVNESPCANSTLVSITNGQFREPIVYSLKYGFECLWHFYNALKF